MESGAYDIELLATLDDHGRPWLVVVDASGSTAKWLARIRGVTRRRAAYVVAVLEMYVGSLDPLRSTTPKMRTLLERSLACLSEDARRHFALMGGLPDESRVPAAVLADLWETDDPRATIRELVAAGLLDVAGPDQFSLHSLINAFASLLLHDGQHDTTAARRRSRARRDRPTG